MDEPDPLLAVAEAKMRALHSTASAADIVAATLLLADIYRTGLRYGITPADWSFVSSLGHDCLDATRHAGRRRPGLVVGPGPASRARGAATDLDDPATSRNVPRAGPSDPYGHSRYREHGDAGRSR